MNETEQKLLDLSKSQNLSSMGLREIARFVGTKNPQTIKYYIAKLEKQDLLKINNSVNRDQKRFLGKSDLITIPILIPILGAANCGPATRIANGEVEGYLKISSKLLPSTNYGKLFALRAVGSSMDKANIDGDAIKDGDYVIVDSSKCSPDNNKVVVAVVDNLANIKRFFKDDNQVVLLSDSSQDFLPIFIHPDDNKDILISGTVVKVLHKPSTVV